MCSSSSKLHQCDVFVFGISGATCSGKSAVTDYLCDTQQHTIVIHQDDYYLPDHLIPRTESGTYTNWDIIEAIDTAKFLETLRTAIKYPHRSCEECSSARSEPAQPHVTHTVLVEGTMILDVKELCDLLHAVFFITLDYVTCKQRRDGRTYPSDVGVYLDPPGYFENVAWPEYLRLMKVASSLAAKNDDSFAVCLLDGGSETLSELQTDVEGVFSKRISLLGTCVQ